MYNPYKEKVLHSKKVKLWYYTLVVRIVKVRYDLEKLTKKGGELVFSKTFYKSMRNLQLSSRTINKEIIIESANSDL